MYWASTLIDVNPLNAGALFDFIESNNLMFGANGRRTFKWDGTTVTNWGIAPPSAAPTVNTKTAPAAVPVAINAPTGTTATSGGSGRTGTLVTFFTAAPHGLNAGDFIQIAGVTPDSFNGFFVIEQVQTPTEFDYHQAGIDQNVTAAGTVYSANASGAYRPDHQVKITIAAAHGRLPGDRVVIAGITDATYNATVPITSVPSPTQFTYDPD